MFLTVKGKMHMEGTSKKTGKPYSFHQVHYLGKARGVEGEAAKTLNIDPSLIAYPDIVVGAQYNADFDGTYCISFTRVK